MSAADRASPSCDWLGIERFREWLVSNPQRTRSGWPDGIEDLTSCKVQRSIFHLKRRVSMWSLALMFFSTCPTATIDPQWIRSLVSFDRVVWL
jgi:hypothetical protein